MTTEKITADNMLNSEQTVGRVVRTFAAELLRELANDQVGIVGWVERESYSLNALFLGIGVSAKYPDLYRDPAWNIPEGLGASIAKTMKIDGSIRASVRAAFAMLAMNIINATELAEDRRQPYIDAVCALMIGALLGLPGQWRLPE